MRGVIVREFGGPEAMRLEPLDLRDPRPGEALVRVAAAGVNFIDLLQRSGRYPVRLPLPMGLEGAGIVEALGPEVATATVGDRVAWTGLPGSYATHVIVPASRLVPVPAELALDLAAAAMLQGMTAHYLARSTYALGPGETCLIQSASSGVGFLLTQIAKLTGATVIATVSTPEKASIARDAGADEVIVRATSDFVSEVDRITGRAGVSVVYDSVGRDTFEGGLRCLRRRGCMVSFGHSSGDLAPFDTRLLNTCGSIYLTRPGLGAHIASREELEERARDVLGWVASGRVRLRLGARFGLEGAGSAHRLLERREAAGKTLLEPGLPPGRGD